MADEKKFEEKKMEKPKKKAIEKPKKAPELKEEPKAHKKEEPKAEHKARKEIPAGHKAEEKPVEAPKAPEAKTEAPKEKKKARKVKKEKNTLSRGKRKEAVARAVISKGKGRFVFNRILFSQIPNKYIREIVMEPLNFIGAELHSMDIKVYVRGGGQMGQAQAARVAISKALVGFTADDTLKKTFLDHDRSLLIEDVRRVEPKKYKGPKARARFQKSYR